MNKQAGTFSIARSFKNKNCITCKYNTYENTYKTKRFMDYVHGLGSRGQSLIISPFDLGNSCVRGSNKTHVVL